jgi:excinuclease UvrABC ATPase subunit
MGAGTPEEIVATPGSVTGDFLRGLLPSQAPRRRRAARKVAAAA